MAVGTAVVAVLGLTSCLDSAVPQARPIKIGTLLSSTLDVDNWLAAEKAAARSIDARGGIKGRPVQIENCDDHFDPNGALACVHKLVNDGVVATASDFTEFGALQAPVFDQAGVPEIGPFVFSQEEATLPTSFPWQGGNTNRLAALIFGIKLRHLHTLYIATWDVPGERALLPLAAIVARQAGVTIVGQELIPQVATNFTPYVEAAIRSGADAFYAAMPPAPQLQFLQQARQQHAAFVVAIPGGELEPGQVRQLGGRDSVTENDIEFQMYPPLSAASQYPGLQAFQRDMDAEVRAGDASAAADRRNGGVLSAWMCVEMIAELASGLETVTAATLLHALRTVPSVSTMGLTPDPWYPNQPTPRMYPRTTLASGYFVTQTEGVERLADTTPFDTFKAMGFPG